MMSSERPAKAVYHFGLAPQADAAPKRLEHVVEAFGGAKDVATLVRRVQQAEVCVTFAQAATGVRVSV
jgi:predicted lipid-binding transport protein (Tim44 family)